VQSLTCPITLRLFDKECLLPVLWYAVIVSDVSKHIRFIEVSFLEIQSRWVSA